MYGNSDANDFRRKWDTDEYERKALERMNSKRKDKNNDVGGGGGGGVEGDEEDKGESSKEPPKKRENLKARDFKIDLESKLGKTVVISKATPSSQAGGFYCDVCDCVVKDSINYLDHINGKKHQRNLGMNMRIKRASLEDVKARFEAKLKEKNGEKKEFDMEEKMKELKEEEQKLKEYRKQKKKTKKRRRQEEEEDEVDDDDGDRMASLMGFASFGSKKKK